VSDELRAEAGGEGASEGICIEKQNRYLLQIGILQSEKELAEHQIFGLTENAVVFLLTQRPVCRLKFPVPVAVLPGRRLAGS
jgi:hypothetical protein